MVEAPRGANPGIASHVFRGHRMASMMRIPKVVEDEGLTPRRSELRTGSPHIILRGRVQTPLCGAAKSPGKTAPRQIVTKV
jgi:hypothetical protein